MGTKDITLPSGTVAVIRDYTTRKDDKKARSKLMAGITAKGKANESLDESEMEYSLGAIDEMNESYVYTMTESIGGRNVDIEEMIDNLPSADYESLEAAVLEVLEEINQKKATKS